ncbi:hypothetical protein KH5H1_07270 [Corallococcus caeni]|nr:hypothetical protein KH5H1_07270 [Corallococcus sp. KH5-1]
MTGSAPRLEVVSRSAAERRHSSASMVFTSVCINSEIRIGLPPRGAHRVLEEYKWHTGHQALHRKACRAACGRARVSTA